MQPEMPAQEVENIMDLSALYVSLKRLSESMPLGVLRTSAKVMTIILVNKKWGLPLMLKMPKACKQILKLGQHLDDLLKIPSVIKIATAQRDKIAVRDGKKDFQEFVKVLIEHVKETEGDIYCVFNDSEDYPTFDYKLYEPEDFYNQRALIQASLEKFLYNPDAQQLDQYIELMRCTLKDKDYITPLGLPRCPFCPQPERTTQQQHLFFAIVQIITDFIKIFDSRNFHYSTESEALLRCVALIKGPQNFRNWKCIKRIVASFHAGTRKYRSEYLEFNRLYLSQYNQNNEIEVAEEKDQSAEIKPEQSQ